jgi:Na+/H+ antiporter
VFDTAQIIVLLLLAAMALGVVARWFGIAYPIALTVGGLVLGFVPHLPHVQLDPAIVFGVFLPPILYHAALYGRWHEFRANIRVITALAIALVTFTTVVVAVASKLMIPELPWAVAFVLGAIVSPPDAVAATAIMQRLNLPPRLVAVIEGESLVNDATAIIIYKFALAAVLTGAFSIGQALGEFVVVAAGGIVVGLLLGWGSMWINRLLDDTLSETMLSLTVPFISYWIAEAFGVSGVLAVVMTGMWRGLQSPMIISAEVRQRARATWDAIVFVLNSLVFVLIGLQLRPIVQSLTAFSWPELIAYAAGIGVATILARAAWIFPAAFISRAACRYLGIYLDSKYDAAPPWRAVAVLSYVGLRGIVSLAVALAVPLTLPDGAPFPNRDLVVFLTFAVIVMTLVLQGLSLPLVLRILGFDGSGGADFAAEEHLARVKMAHAAVAEVDRVTEQRQLPARLVERVRAEFAGPLADLEATPNGEKADASPAIQSKRNALRLAAVRAARRRLVKLHREDEISDATLQQLLRELDFEELRLERRPA